MSTVVNSEYRQGMDAYYAGKARTSNPYDNGPLTWYTDAAGSWYAGYDDAQFDDAEFDESTDNGCFVCGAEPGESCAADCEDRH